MYPFPKIPLLKNRSQYELDAVRVNVEWDLFKTPGTEGAYCPTQVYRLT